MDDIRNMRRVLDTRAIRERLGNISQGALAEIACVDQSSVSLWETGRTAPTRAAETLILRHCDENRISPAFKELPIRTPPKEAA